MGSATREQTAKKYIREYPREANTPKALRFREWQEQIGRELKPEQLEEYAVLYFANLAAIINTPLGLEIRLLDDAADYPLTKLKEELAIKEAVKRHAKLAWLIDHAKRGNKRRISELNIMPIAGSNSQLAVSENQPTRA